jgi:hypothetical protein
VATLWKEPQMCAPLRITALVLALGITVLVVRTNSPAAAAAAGQALTTTLDDQVELAVTVYNSNIALIRDIRNVTLARGTSDVRFMDIAATVNPATVHFRSLSEPSRVSVLEQNYEYDLLEPDKLLRKYVGRDVTLVRTRQDGAFSREEPVKARLLSFNVAPVWQIGNEIVTEARRSHPFPGVAGDALFTADPHLDATERRRVEPSSRGVVSRWRDVLARGLRADR